MKNSFSRRELINLLGLLFISRYKNPFLKPQNNVVEFDSNNEISILKDDGVEYLVITNKDEKRVFNSDGQIVAEGKYGKPALI